MFGKFRLASALAIPLAGALAFSTVPSASAMTVYASPTALKSAGAISAQPVHYWRHRRYYGGYEGAAFAAAAMGMIAAIAASSHDGCDWDSCDDYGYGGGPYYGGWGGGYGYGHWGRYGHWGHWGGGHWGGGHWGGGGWAGHHWNGGGQHFAFAHGGGHGGGFVWRRH